MFIEFYFAYFTFTTKVCLFGQAKFSFRDFFFHKFEIIAGEIQNFIDHRPTALNIQFRTDCLYCREIGITVLQGEVSIEWNEFEGEQLSES